MPLKNGCHGDVNMPYDTIYYYFSVLSHNLNFLGEVWGLPKFGDSLRLELEENFAIYVLFLFTQYAFTLQCIIENFVRFLGKMMRQGG